MKIERILVGTDFSPASSPAFERAVQMAAKEGAELLVAHVVRSPAPIAVDGGILPQTYDELERAMRENAARRLARLVERARRRGVRADALVLRGVTHDAITDTARRCRASLIVVGTHGRSGLARLFLGSVASRVIASAPCPVLAVPARGRPRRRTA